jgi:hypothetical protein
MGYTDLANEVGIACTWCGFFTRPGPACELCGSPTPTGFSPALIPDVVPTLVVERAPGAACTKAHVGIQLFESPGTPERPVRRRNSTAQDSEPKSEGSRVTQIREARVRKSLDVRWVLDASQL